MAQFLDRFLNKFKDPEAGNITTNFLPSGTSGTEIFSGDFFEEYLAKFQNMPHGMDTYDMMRRSDYTITALLKSIKNPIIRANWFVEEVDDSNEEQEIKDFASFLLFEDMGYPDGSKSKKFRDEFLNEALSNQVYGFSAFEIINKIVMGHPKWGNYIGIKDLAYRSPRTIEEWHLLQNGGIKSIRQCVDGDLAVDVNIDGRYLLVYTLDKEGDNYEGISPLRPIYGNWFRKNIYLKLQALGIERGMGCPKAMIPESKSADPSQVEKVKEVLKRFTSHELNYLIFPEGFDVDNFVINHDSEKLDKSIDAEDGRMSKAFLANFLELANNRSGTGSYALGTDLSDMFLSGIQMYADQIADGINDKVLKTLIDAKFGKREKYPKLRVTDINDKAGKEKAEILVMLAGAGLITPSDQLEEQINQSYGLPVLTPEQLEQEKQKVQSTEPAIPETPKEEPEVPKPEKKTLAEIEQEEGLLFAEGIPNPSLFITQKKKDVFAFMQAEQLSRSDKFIEKTKKFFDKETSVQKRRKFIQELQIPGKSEYKGGLKLNMAQLAQEATENVMKELGRSGLQLSEADDILKDLPKATRDKIRAEVDAIVETQDADMRKALFFIVSQKLDTTDSVDALIADMRSNRDRYLRGASFRASAFNSTSGTVNTARNAVFQTPEVFDEIESFVVVNPVPVALICQELVGRVFTKDEYLTADLPPWHFNCDSTIRAQLTEQKRIQPVDPIGLLITGTPAQVAAIEKSRTF